MQRKPSAFYAPAPRSTNIVRQLVIETTPEGVKRRYWVRVS